MTDTSREAVERLADQLRGEGDAHFRSVVRDRRTIGAIMVAGGETLRAMLDERARAQAREAAAYEAAAQQLTPLLSSALAAKDAAHTGSHQTAMAERADGLELGIRRIRALATQEENDALDRLIAEAVTKEREACAQYLIDSIPTDAAPESIVAWVLRDRLPPSAAGGKAMSDDLNVWPEHRPQKTEAERSEYARKKSSHLPPISGPFPVSENDLTAMRAAFVARFDEPLPKSETLMRVAAIGYRMALRDA